MPPCGWTPTALCVNLLGVDATTPPEIQAAATATATEIIWKLSGRRYGPCPVTVRPCRQDCGSAPFGPWLPFYYSDQWWTLGCGVCGGDSCSCDVLSEIVLPGVIAEVCAIKVDGATLVAGTDYVVYDSRRIVRVGDTWPACNDLTQPDTEVGTWSIRYAAGEPVPDGGNLAAGRLACELVKMLLGQACGLPERVKSVSRQGVDMTILDPQDFLTEGRTGIYDIDLWLFADNPHGLASQASFYSLDRPPPRIQTQ